MFAIKLWSRESKNKSLVKIVAIAKLGSYGAAEGPKQTSGDWSIKAGFN